MLTQIINARILTPQGWLKDGSVLIRDNKILEVTNCDLAIIGAKLIEAPKRLSGQQSRLTCSMVPPVFFLPFLLLPFR